MEEQGNAPQVHPSNQSLGIDSERAKKSVKKEPRGIRQEGSSTYPVLSVVVIDANDTTHTTQPNANGLQKNHHIGRVE